MAKLLHHLQLKFNKLRNIHEKNHKKYIMVDVHLSIKFIVMCTFALEHDLNSKQKKALLVVKFKHSYDS